jgi:hypothetical protein
LNVESGSNRRQWPRLQLTLNVRFSADGQEANGAGITDNVSAGGLYFLTPSWRGLRERQSLSMRLSGMSSYDQGMLFRTLGGRATILRLDLPEDEGHSHAKAGVAVRFDERPRIEVYDLPA